MNAVVLGLVVGLNTLAYFHYHGNPHFAGFLFGALGVGALIGAIVAQQLTKSVELLKLSALAIVAMPLPLWLLSIAMPWPAAMVVIGAFSFFTPLVNAPVLSFAFAGVLLRNRAATDVAAVPDVAHG